MNPKDSNRENLTLIDPEPLYHLVDRPEWILGGEEGANPKRTSFKKDEILFALTSLTFYSEFNASMGFQFLYNIASAQKDVVCERIFYPELKLERFLRKHKMPLFSLESKLASYNFDILAFSIFHIPEFLNILEMFDLSRLPYKAEWRMSGKYPLIVAGGIFTLNPEPISAFFDVICIGDGDDWLREFLIYYREHRDDWESGEADKKRKFLEGLAESVSGTYVPILTEVAYDDEAGTITRTPSLESQRSIRKRVADITRQSSEHLKRVIMSRTEKEAFTKAIEVARGCRWGCRFCVVTAFYRPYRERPLEVLKEVVDYRKSLGINQIGVGAPTPPDYSHIAELANHIISLGMRFDIQSERMDTFSEEAARAHVLSGRRNVSLAIEACSERVRREINKNLPESTIFKAITNGLKANFRALKLMFMLCHPWEKPSDVSTFESFLTKVFELREKHNPRTFFRVSICPFIPKPWTTFQWAPLRLDSEMFEAANRAIESARRTPIGAHRFAVQFAGGPTSRWFDTVFSRGDRRLADVFIMVHTKAKPHNDMLYEFPYSAATKKCVSAMKGYMKAFNLPSHKYVEGYKLTDDLPWDFVNIGIKKEWLLKDWERAKKGIENVSCKDGCAGCGACPTYKDLDIPHPNTYQSDPFKLDVTFQQFVKAKRSSRAGLPSRTFSIYFRKSDRATRINFQDLRRIVARLFQNAGFKAPVRSINSLSHQFYNGMSWNGLEVVDVRSFIPFEFTTGDLEHALKSSWSSELGDILEIRELGHSFKRDLRGITIMTTIKPTPQELDEFRITASKPHITVRVERTSEKKSGDGITSEHVDVFAFLEELRIGKGGFLEFDIKRGGNAYEIIEALTGVPRTVSERYQVSVLNPIMKDSWERK